MKTSYWVVPLVVLLVVGGSCMTPSGGQYKYGDVTYSSADQALQAQREKLEKMLSEIHESPEHIAGSALVVVPSRERVGWKGVKVTGKGKLPKGAVEYVLSSALLTYEGMGRALQKYNLFDKLDICSSEDPASYKGEGYGFIVYLNLVDQTSAQWFVKLVATDKKEPVHSDNSLPEGTPRLVSWLESAAKACRQLQQ